MASRFCLWMLLNTLIILTRGHLKIPLDSGGWDKQLNEDIDTLFRILDDINRFMGCYSIIAYTGSFDLRPSLEQRLMEHFSAPVYTVASQSGPLNHRYSGTNNVVIALFSGLDDSTLAALNDPELSEGITFFSFLYVPPNEDNRLLTMAEMREFFTWCYEREFYSVFVFFRGESELESWSYYYSSNVTVSRVTEELSLENIVRRQGQRFRVQAANDPPEIFVCNSSEQADVIRGENLSLSGPVGILMVEFMRYLNASMDILPIREKPNANYDILTVASNQSVDVVTNLVVNDSILFSPILARSPLCVMVPRRRTIPLNRMFDKLLTGCWHWVLCVTFIFVCGVKYMAHRRRSLVNSFLSTLRFNLGIPLPGGQLDRLPLADKIVEVYCLLFVGILISIFGSLLSSALTTGVYHPPVTDVESMRASGLRIMTTDHVTMHAFKDDQMSSSLADLVDVVDDLTFMKDFLELNDSHAYMVLRRNWLGLRLYEERMEKKRFTLAGPKLCSRPRDLRLPISPKSPLRFLFSKYFHMVFESGLQEKWMRMGLQQFWHYLGITKLPRNTENEFKALTLAFYAVFIKIYIGGMLLSTLVFVIEILYKRYHG